MGPRLKKLHREWCGVGLIDGNKAAKRQGRTIASFLYDAGHQGLADTAGQPVKAKSCIKISHVCGFGQFNEFICRVERRLRRAGQEARNF